VRRAQREALDKSYSRKKGKKEILPKGRIKGEEKRRALLYVQCKGRGEGKSCPSCQGTALDAQQL